METQCDLSSCLGRIWVALSAPPDVIDMKYMFQTLRLKVGLFCVVKNVKHSTKNSCDIFTMTPFKIIVVQNFFGMIAQINDSRNLDMLRRRRRREIYINYR